MEMSASAPIACFVPPLKQIKTRRDKTRQRSVSFKPSCLLLDGENGRSLHTWVLQRDVRRWPRICSMTYKPTSFQATK